MDTYSCLGQSFCFTEYTVSCYVTYLICLDIFFLSLFFFAFYDNMHLQETLYIAIKFL